MPGDSSNLDRQIGMLIERTESMGRELHEIRNAIDRFSQSNAGRVQAVEMRVAALELIASKREGGSRMAALIFGAAATLGGIIAHLAGKFWPH
jgi:hypothetical protein